MTKDISDRLKSAFKPHARIADVKLLITDIEREIAADIGAKGKAERIAASVDSSDAKAEQASADINTLDRKIARRRAQLEQLTTRRDEMLESDRQKTLRARLKAWQADNDQLAADIEAEWPVLVAGLVALLDRLEKNDMEAETLIRDRAAQPGSLLSAEARARGCQGNFVRGGNGAVMTVKRFAQYTLPSLEGLRPAWPHDSRGQNAAQQEYYGRVQ